MSYSSEALKAAIELEKKAIEKYREAINSSTNDETKEALKKFVEETNQHVESASWIVMAESGKLEQSADSQPQETGATRLAAGKCPFSGQFKEMGIDLDNFDPSSFDMSKMKEMGKEMGIDMEGFDMSKIKDKLKSS